MQRRWTTQVLIAAIMISIIAIAGCGGSSVGDPKATVISMFGAMEKDDQGSLANLLDLRSLMTGSTEDYALQTNQAREWSNPQALLEDLTGSGLTKQRWFAYQRIIGQTNVSGESATVEVTFVDKKNSEGYMTLFGLHVVKGKWRIYSFKVTQQAP